MLEIGFMVPNNHIYTVDKMLEVGLVGQNIKNVALFSQGKSCVSHKRNVIRWHCGTKSNHVVAEDQMLDGGFVAKASSLKPMPILLYILAQINGGIVSWVDNEARHSFTSHKVTRELGLANA